MNPIAEDTFLKPAVFYLQPIGESYPGQELAGATGDDSDFRGIPVDELRVALEEDERLYAIVLYSDPTKEIALKLQQGWAAATAVITWRTFAERLAELHTQFWERMTVAVQPNEELELDALSSHVTLAAGIERADLPDVQLSDGPKSASFGPGLELAAAHLLTLSKVREVSTRLEAITLDTRASDTAHELVTRFVDAHKELTRTAAEKKVLEGKLGSKESRYSRTAEENNLLLEQLHKTQEQVENLLSSNGKLEERVRAMQRGRDFRKNKIAALKEEKTDLEAQLTEVSSKNDWLRTVRDKHRETARGLRQENRTLQERLREIETHLNEAESELRGVKESRSWRYSQNLRRMLGSTRQA